MTSFFNDLLNSIAERGRALVERGDVRAANDDPVRLAERLLSQSGEASALAIADRLLDLYDRLDGPARAAFFQALADRFGPDLAAVETAIARYAGNPSSAEAARLHAVAEPRRQDLVRKLNRTARGTERLVRMRADLLAAGGRPNAFSEVDADFEHLFRSWFNRGFLVLQPITWNTPAIILEKIIAYEAVHEICSWED
ncbi:MAG: malonyl-CoA decarboxylase N-terminal domain-containing protein, partial [Pseudomonadota bacterium]